MRLPELIPGAADVEITGLAYDKPCGDARDAVLLACPASPVMGTTSRPTRSRRGGRRPRRPAPARPRRARGARRRRGAPPWRPVAARFHGDPTARPRRRRPSRGPTARRRRPSWCAGCSRAAGRRTALLGTVKSVIGGLEDTLGAPRRRRPSTCRPPSRGCWTAAIARVRWRSPATRSSCDGRTRSTGRWGVFTKPDPGPPRLPRDDGGLLRRQAAAVRGGAPRVRGDQRRRSVRPTAGRRARRADHLRDRRPTPTWRATRRAHHAERRRVHGRGHAPALTAARALSTSPTSSPPSRSPGPLGVEDETIERSLPGGGPPCPGASSPSTRASPSPSSSTTRNTPDSLENVLRAGARAHVGPGQS